jgi:hypothetical protein
MAKEAQGTTRAGVGQVARLNDGSEMYYCPEGGQRGGQVDRGTRVSQAKRYPTHDDAEFQANQFQTNSRAKEYLVVRLPQPLPSHGG